MDKEKEQEVIEKCLKGDERAWKLLYDNYKGKLFPVCLRYGADTQEAEDMFQEGFLKVFKGLHHFRNDGNFLTWSRRVMANSAISFLRRKKKLIFGEDILMDYFNNNNLESEVILKMSADEVLVYLKELPSGYRTVFSLYAIEGFSHKEIGQALEIKTSTSRSQYTRAKKMLIEIIYKDLGVKETFKYG